VSLPGRKIIFNPMIHSEKTLSRFFMVSEDNHFLRLVDRLSEKYDNATVKKVMIDCYKMFVEYYRPALDNEFYMLDYTSMFENLDQHIYKLFDYLEISIDSDRSVQWHEIYQIYKEKNNQDFYEKFLNNQLVIKNQQTAILKEILSWKNGSFLNT
jgi:hypothetical protein